MTSIAETEKIAVVGLGYVGLPLAIALAKKFKNTIGFDVSSRRIEALLQKNDWTGEVGTAELNATTLRLSTEASAMKGCNFFIVTVPTPVDEQHRPDLSPLKSACEFVGPLLVKGSVVVFESTVYPGVTEDFCGPLLERHSGLKAKADFSLGYSPERINPGDKEHRLENILKIISADSPATLTRLRAVYGSIIEAGLHEAPTIKVAEAAKVLENTQRDINIALMNELAVILDRMDIRTKDVLTAAGTKWNFLKFSPGLVGGHCIGVDPYYLTSAAEAHGYNPYVILSGRRINDEMGQFIARKTIKLMVKQGQTTTRAKVGIFGLTFKENVSDLRNSKVPDIITELTQFGVDCLVHDPYAEAAAAFHEYGLKLSSLDDMRNLDAVILAVNHKPYLTSIPDLVSRVKKGGVFIDVKSAIEAQDVPGEIAYWSL